MVQDKHANKHMFKSQSQVHFWKAVGREGWRRGEGCVSVHKCDGLGAETEKQPASYGKPNDKKEDCPEVCVEAYSEVILEVVALMQCAP